MPAVVANRLAATASCSQMKTESGGRLSGGYSRIASNSGTVAAGDRSGDVGERREDRGFERAAVVRAADFGLERMRVLMEEYEPLLYERGAVVSTRAPAHYVAAFNAQGDRERKLAQFGYAALQATSLLVQRAENDDPYDDEEFAEERVGQREKPQPRRSRGWRVASYPRVSLRHTALGRQCPTPSAPQPCPEGRAGGGGGVGGGGAGAKYRAIDGRCNSPEHPERGAAGTPLRRLLPPHYKDGLERPREAASGGPLPSARAVSVAVHGQRDIDLAAVTHLLMQWGQLIDHDLTASAQSRGFNSSVPKCCTDDGSSTMPSELLHPDCMPIPVARDDWFLGPLGVRCMDFVRSGAAPRPGCALGPRDQLNRVTAFLDGSAVYGSTAADARRLRLRRGGLLRYRRVSGRLPLLPAAARGAAVQLCAAGSAAGGECFDAGDGRVNEQPGLIAAHALLLRAHNRFATRLAHLNAHWSDERVFQEARRLVAATMQHITYREFLPLVLGPDIVKSFGLELTRRGYYKGYEPEVNPAIFNAFATAAFRFGHSLVQNSLLRCDRSHRPLIGSNVSLHEELTKPNYIHHAGSVDKLLLGMCAQPAQKRDEFITEQLTNHLFQTSKYLWGMDLAALNIQRGRDHGLAPYNSWREACGLQPFTSWVQMLKVMSPETQRKLKSIYRDIDDIDLFPGAMAEKPVSGGLVGPTFACIIAQQFSNLRKGDRFWYENGGFESSFTPAQLQQIRKISLARILCDNLDSIDTIQPFVFLASDNDRNVHKSCGKISSFDLSPWTEHRIVNEYDHPEDDHNYDHVGHHEDHHHHYEIPTPPPPLHHNHHDHYNHHNPNDHHDSYHPTNHHDNHDSYHPTNNHDHLDSYNKPTTSFPNDDYSEPSYHIPSYEKPHTSPHDHYKPPHNDYETPVLLYNERPTPSSHYDYTTTKPTYILKPQNNYSITYIYEFDYEHKPQPTPTISYSKPRPSIKPTSTYTVIHLHQSVEHVTHQSLPSYSDSYSSDHSKPQHSKPHDDSYLPDHSHHQSGSYSPPKYPVSPSYDHRPHPSFDDNYKPPSVDNYGPVLTYHSDQSHDSYRPQTDTYHPHKPHEHHPNNYKPHNTQTYKPHHSDYGHFPSPLNYGPPSETYGHANPPNKYEQTIVKPYGSLTPISNKYPSTSAHHYGISINQQINNNNKVTTLHTSHNTKPLSESPVLVNYPKPEIIYSGSKPPAYENNLHLNYPKPILLKGSSADHTVIEIPPDRSHSCKSKMCSETTSIIYQDFLQTSLGIKGDNGKFGSSREHPKTSTSSNSKPLHLTEFFDKPILLYTSPSTKQSIPHRLKGGRPNPQENKEAEGSNSKLPAPGLDAHIHDRTYQKKNISEKWSFDVRELEDEEEFSDVPFLPTDPESSRELPQPILEPEELNEDEDIFSRSL